MLRNVVFLILRSPRTILYSMSFSPNYIISLLSLAIFLGTGCQKQQSKSENHDPKAPVPASSLAIKAFKDGYRRASRPEPDWQKVKDSYDKGCRLEYWESCQSLGQLYTSDKLGQPNIKAALTAYEAACKLNDRRSCRMLGKLDEKRFDGGQPPRSRHYFGRACELGDFIGCGRLGYMELTGLGGPKKPDTGLIHLTQSCQKGSAYACNQLGYSYESGQSIDQDFDKARHFYQKSCEQNNWIACSNYAKLISMEKYSSEVDTINGIRMYKKAIELAPSHDERPWQAFLMFTAFQCEGGSRAACFEYGQVLETGRVEHPQPQEIFIIYDRGCNNTRGVPEACLKIAEFLESGFGIDQDKDAAQSLRQRLCDMGIEPACEVGS